MAPDRHLPGVFSCERSPGGCRKGDIFHFCLVGRALSESLVLNDSLFAAIVTTFAAHGVIDVPGATVGAECQGGSDSLVVSTTLGRTGLRLFAFRMCHCCLFVLLFLF